MKKPKLLPVFLAFMMVLAGCQQPHKPDEMSHAESGESKQTSVVETTTAETSATEVSTQVIAEPTEETLFQNYGASNTVNSGICCTDGERFYYSDTNTKKLYQTENGTATEVADQFYGYYLNLSGDCIYYADAAADNCITAYNLTSGNRTVICNMHVQELTLYKEKLYFTCTDGERRTVYRMNTDGSGLESLANCEDLWYMTIYKDVVYYVNYENDQYAIISMNPDGTDSRMIRKYNASDLCIAEDKIFFAERDTRYLYSMNLDGSDVRQLNSTYSRCLNYMNGQLYYYSSKESGRNIYSCDLEGNITGRYASGAKFLMLMENELYYYDWDEVLHVLPLDKKSEEENYSYGTNITSYEQKDILTPVYRYLETDWSGYTLDENNITKQGNTWTILLTKSGSQQQYQLTIDLTTGRVTIICITEDILPISVYLYDNATVQLSEEELRRIADDWYGRHYEVGGAWWLEYHDYDGNGTYEAFAVCGPVFGAGFDTDSYNILNAVLYISSTGEITVIDKDFQDVQFNVGNGINEIDYYIEYGGKGYYIPHFRSGSITWQYMYGVRDDKPYDTGISGHIGLDEDGDLSYYPNSGYGQCPDCGYGKSGKSAKQEHKHILFYNETSDEFEVAVKYPSGEIVKYEELFS